MFRILTLFLQLRVEIHFHFFGLECMHPRVYALLLTLTKSYCWSHDYLFSKKGKQMLFKGCFRMLRKFKSFRSIEKSLFIMILQQLMAFFYDEKREMLVNILGHVFSQPKI